jgi:polysaccharide biosynthesis protein PslH
VSKRVLFLTHTTPFPMVSGERIRSFNLMQQLTRLGWHVSLFSLSRGRVEKDPRCVLEETCETVVIAQHAPSPMRRAVHLLRDIGLRRAFHRTYFWNREAFRDLAELLARQRFDLIVASQLYMAPYVPERCLGRTVFDSINAEARRLLTIASSGHGMRRISAQLQLSPVRAFEIDFARRCAHVLAVSDQECEYFRAFVPSNVSLIPNGVDTKRFGQRQSPASSTELLFMGSLDYSANEDAVIYLTSKILPKLIGADLAVTLVGSQPSRAVEQAARRAPIPVHVTGFVESTEPYIRRARALVVPLRHGAGTRLKILEALACGLPVISTTVGCEGLGLEHGREVLVADEPAQFAHWIERVLHDDELCGRLSSNGRRTVQERFDWTFIGGRLDDVLTGVVDRVGNGRRR